jgi:WD40 repeat protein/serine/threonine protein kinase
MSAKHNLLLGILALQNNFISRAQLLAGFNAWVEDKGQALADLLLEQKAISPAQHALLVALTAEHLRQHGHDADQSLAALSSADSARRDLEQIADAEVQASLAPLASGNATVSSGDRGGLSVTCTVPPPAPPDRGGRFRILRPHAAGGLGQVSVALDQELNREVALKEIKEEHSHDSEARARFLLEAEITGGLEHPGIVPVYSLGSYGDGRPFYAMRFIQGDSLKDGIQQFHRSPSAEEASGPGGPPPDFQSLAFRKLLGRFVDVCNAIAYAHSRGVLHRDLKPGNIMLGKYGETLVVDWGLAKAAGAWREARSERDEPTLRPGSGSGSSETLPGSALGTPAYMSPEQAAGRVDELGPASDVYSLGATLYHLLTGTVPFKGKNPLEILKMVKAGDLLEPRQVQPAIPAALEAVCCKAMVLRAADRYASARELADEVERWLADEPVRAWPEPWTVKMRRWTNRHRVLVSSVAACLVVASVALIAGIVLIGQANADLEAESKKTMLANTELKTAYGKVMQSEKEARGATAAEAKARDHAEDLLATSTMMLAKSRFEENQGSLAEDLLEQVPARFRFPPWRLLKNYVAGSLFTLRGHTTFVTSVAFAPEGQVLASASGDGTVKLWDARTGQEIRTLRGHTQQVASIAFAPQGQVLASASFDNTVKLWDVQTGQELRTLRGHTDWVSCVAFAADGYVLATASKDKTVKLWDARSGQELRTLSGHMQQVYEVAFAADGQMLASASGDTTVRLWDARTGQALRTLRGHTHSVTSVAFAADCQMLASASGDNTVKLWDTKTGQEFRTQRGHTASIGSVAFTPDGQVLASASWDGTVRLWDARTGQELRTLRGHTHWVTSVAFAGDGQVLASASTDGTVKLWDARPGQELRTLRGYTDPVVSVAFTANSQVLASASQSWHKTVNLWDVQTGRELHTLRGHKDSVTSVAFAADGQMLASASNDKTVKLWDVQTGRELHTLRGHKSSLSSVAFAADGQMLASASDNTVKLWDVRTGQELRTLRGHTDYIKSVAFAADAQVLASASFDNTIKLWDARTGEELRTLRGHTNWVTSVAFPADGQMLAPASWDGTVKLWDARTGQELRTLRGHTQEVTSLAFAADGHVLASASEDHTVKLWDTRTRKQLSALRGHRDPVISIAFAADGQMMASASATWNNSVKLWDVRTGQELRTLRGHTDLVSCVAFTTDGQVLASASYDKTVKLWDARSGQELRTLRGHTTLITSVAFAADGRTLWSYDAEGRVLTWDVATGKRIPHKPPPFSPLGGGAWSPDGNTLALGQPNGLILLVPKAISESERRFRLWVTSPDLHLHQDYAEAAERNKQSFAQAFRLGRYLAAKNYYAAESKKPAMLTGWLAAGGSGLGLLPGLPIAVGPALREPAFADGLACTGVLYKDSGIAPERLVLGTARAVRENPANWLHQAFHGGALYRSGQFEKALVVLTEAAHLHGKPSPLTHNLLALTYLALGQKDKANAASAQAQPGKDASWEDTMLQHLFEPEITADIAPEKSKGGKR